MKRKSDVEAVADWLRSFDDDPIGFDNYDGCAKSLIAVLARRDWHKGKVLWFGWADPKHPTKLCPRGGRPTTKRIKMVPVALVAVEKR